MITTMRKLILTSGGIILTANLLAGLLLSAYHGMNMWINNGIVIFTTTLLLIIASSDLRDGFKISLSMLFSAIGFVAFVLCLFAKPQIRNNWVIIVLVVLLGIEALITATIFKVNPKQ